MSVPLPDPMWWDIIERVRRALAHWLNPRVWPRTVAEMAELGRRDATSPWIWSLPADMPPHLSQAYRHALEEARSEHASRNAEGGW